MPAHKDDVVYETGLTVISSITQFNVHMVVSVFFMLAVRLSDLNSTSVLRFVELQQYLIRNIIKHMGVAGVRFQVNIQQKKLGFYSPSTHEELTGGPAPHCHWLVIWGGRKGSLVIMWLNAHLKVPPCTLFIVWVEVRQVGQCSRCTGRWSVYQLGGSECFDCSQTDVYGYNLTGLAAG